MGVTLRCASEFFVCLSVRQGDFITLLKLANGGLWHVPSATVMKFYILRRLHWRLSKIIIGRTVFTLKRCPPVSVLQGVALHDANTKLMDAWRRAFVNRFKFRVCTDHTPACNKNTIFVHSKVRCSSVWCKMSSCRTRMC